MNAIAEKIHDKLADAKAAPAEAQHAIEDIEVVVGEDDEASFLDIAELVQKDEAAAQSVEPIVLTDHDLYQKRYDLLPRPVEYELANRWLKNGDVRARDRIIAAYERLAISHATRAARSGLAFDDLFQEARIGMILALDAFKPSMGNGFGTFARYHILNAIQIHALKVIAPMRIFNTAATKTLFAKFNAHKKRIEAITGCALTDEGREEICRVLKVDPEQLKRYELALSGTVPLDTGAGNSADDQTRAIELPSGPIDGDADSSMVSKIAREQIKALQKQALASLGVRERKIIVARYQREQPKTLDSLSKSMGISRERVRQIEIRALAELRHFMIENGVDNVGDLYVDAPAD